MSQKRRAHAVGHMSDNARNSTKWALHVPDKITEASEMERTAWVVQATFFSMRYVHDGKYCIGYRNSMEEWRLPSPWNDAILEQALYLCGQMIM